MSADLHTDTGLRCVVCNHLVAIGGDVLVDYDLYACPGLVLHVCRNHSGIVAPVDWVVKHVVRNTALLHASAMCVAFRSSEMDVAYGKASKLELERMNRCVCFKDPSHEKR